MTIAEKKNAFTEKIKGMKKSALNKLYGEIMHYYNDVTKHTWTAYQQWELDTIQQERKDRGYIKGVWSDKKRVAHNYVLINKWNPINRGWEYAETIDKHLNRYVTVGDSDSSEVEASDVYIALNYIAYRVHSKKEIDEIIAREMSVPHGYTYSRKNELWSE